MTETMISYRDIFERLGGDIGETEFCSSGKTTPSQPINTTL